MAKPKDQVLVQHRFTITDAATGRTLSDALVVPLEEYDALSGAAIDRMKRARLKAWLDVVDAPPEEPEPPTPEEQLEGFRAQRDALAASVELVDADAGLDAEALRIALDALDIAIGGLAQQVDEEA